MIRVQLPNRRESETFNISFGNKSYSVTISIYPDGRLGELFAHGAKTGSDMDALLDDACVVLSILLQHGFGPKKYVGSMGRLEDGSPASILGALADVLSGLELRD